MKNLILKYLGYKNFKYDEVIDKLIDDIIKEVIQLANFKYTYLEFKEVMPFLNENQVYLDYLKGSNSYLLCATTLGSEIDKKIKYYMFNDPTKAVIMDAVASARLEYMADDFEKNLKYKNLSYRFCPGYSDTNLDDNKKIAKILDANKKIGIEILDTNLIIPQKSMVGIIAVGTNKEKNCKNCIMNKDCKFLKGGSPCYKN